MLADLLPLAALPEMDGMFFARLVGRILHIIGALIIGGGMFYLRYVLGPAGPEACFADRRAVWARWVGISSFLLLVSGLFNFWAILQDAKDVGEKLPSLYHGLFGAKFLLGLLVMFVAAILAGRTAAADRARANMARWLNIGWAAVLAIVVIGAVLRLLHADAPAEPQLQPGPVAEASRG